MTYRTPDRNHEEEIWNSRDQAVPGKIPRGKVELEHVDAHRDEFRPFWIPRVGSRIWIDPVLDKAEAAAEEFFQEHQHEEAFVKEFGPDPRAARAQLVVRELKTMEETGGVKSGAVLVTVTDELAARIRARLEKRGIR